MLVFPSTGLEKNESIPIPKLEEPRQPNTKEQEHAVEITIAASNDVRNNLIQFFNSFVSSSVALVSMSIGNAVLWIIK